MYSTYFRSSPSTASKVIAWLASPNLVHALGASLLVVATITVAYESGGVDLAAAGAAHAASVPAVALAPTPVPAQPERWNADESASGTRPECAH